MCVFLSICLCVCLCVFTCVYMCVSIHLCVQKTLFVICVSARVCPQSGGHQLSCQSQGPGEATAAAGGAATTSDDDASGEEDTAAAGPPRTPRGHIDTAPSRWSSGRARHRGLQGRDGCLWGGSPSVLPRSTHSTTETAHSTGEVPTRKFIVTRSIMITGSVSVLFKCAEWIKKH